MCRAGQYVLCPKHLDFFGKPCYNMWVKRKENLL